MVTNNIWSSFSNLPKSFMFLLSGIGNAQLKIAFFISISKEHYEKWCTGHTSTCKDSLSNLNYYIRKDVWNLSTETKIKIGHYDFTIIR